MAGEMKWSPGKTPGAAFRNLTVQELADKIARYFHLGKRDSGEEYWYAKDAQEWVNDLIVHPAHGEMMPDDWKYEFIYQSLDAISNSSEEELDSPQIEPDVYNHRLTSWLSSNLERMGYVDEATGEFGHSDQGIVGDIGLGQMREKEEVYYSVLSSLRKIVEED